MRGHDQELAKDKAVSPLPSPPLENRWNTRVGRSPILKLPSSKCPAPLQVALPSHPSHKLASSQFSFPQPLPQPHNSGLRMPRVVPKITRTTGLSCGWPDSQLCALSGRNWNGRTGTPRPVLSSQRYHCVTHGLHANLAHNAQTSNRHSAR